MTKSSSRKKILVFFKVLNTVSKFYNHRKMSKNMDSLSLIFISDLTHRNLVNRLSLMTTLHQMVLKFLNLFKERKVAMVLFGVVIFTTWHAQEKGKTRAVCVNKEELLTQTPGIRKFKATDYGLSQRKVCTMKRQKSVI